MSAKFSNNATSRLSVSLSSSDTTLSVQPGDGAKYPSPVGTDWFPLTIVKATGELEIVYCTERSGDVLTIDRGQESTTAKSFNVGDRVENRMSVGAYESRMAEKFDKTGGTIAGDVQVNGDVTLGAGKKLVFEGTTDDTFEMTVDPGNPTADRTLTAPDKSGTLAVQADVDAMLPLAGGAMTGLLKFKNGANIASATTVDLTAATGNTFHLTGTTPVTGWTMTAGQVMDIIFDDETPIIYHVTNNKLPGYTDITTNPGDTARFFYDGTTVYCLQYQRLDGTSVQDLPAGAIVYFAQTSAPQGYLKANATTLLRSQWPVLFAALVKSGTATISVASPGVVTWNGHNLSANDPVKFRTTGALPTGLTANTTYYVVGASITTNTVQLSATPGGAAINTTGAQSGVHTAINAPHGDGDGTTTFTLPELRGEFIRGWDDGRGVDASRTFSSAQLDQMQGHRHPVLQWTSNTGALAGGGGIGYYVGTPVGDPISDGTNGTPRTGLETRSRNVALLACIKY